MFSEAFRNITRRGVDLLSYLSPSYLERRQTRDWEVLRRCTELQMMAAVREGMISGKIAPTHDLVRIVGQTQITAVSRLIELGAFTPADIIPTRVL